MTTLKLSITDLSIEDRPREKLERHGAEALTTAELLAILIGSGNSEENAVQLMQRVLHDAQDSLAELEAKSIKELCAYKGFGPAKAITIQAACELAKRRMKEQHNPNQTRYTNSDLIYQFFLSSMRGKTVEECRLLLLSQSLGFKGCKLLSRGGLTGTTVDVRLALKEALLAGATCIALCHNHPSGNPNPSLEDDRLTQKLKEAARIMDIKLIDHIILTDHTYFSYANEGKL